MNMPSALVFAGVQHQSLKAHLFPADGLEAAAILLCSRSSSPRVRLLIREIILVPYEACGLRQRNAITWPGSYIEAALDRAEVEDLTLVLMHSHPDGLFNFSTADDTSDCEIMPSLLANHGQFHASAIMTPDGAVRARWYGNSVVPNPIDLVMVCGHELYLWWDSDAVLNGRPTCRPMAFTSGMSSEMGRLTAVVIGVSGTGSMVAEQLNRLGFGRVKHIDFDRMEMKNLNRILNSKISDAKANRLKVDMFVEAVVSYRGEGVAEAIPFSIMTREAVLEAGQGDIVFCCVDTLEARQVVDRIASAYLLPLLDVGVVIPTRSSGTGVAIGDVCGRVDYIQPGQSSLRDRGVYTPESLRAEYLRKNAPDAHRQELDAGYIKGTIEEAPAVISLNMRAAAACVLEFIARAYPYRHEPNQRYARTLFSLAACEEEYFSESSFVSTKSSSLLGRGSLEPLLGLPFLAPPISEEAA